MDTERPRGGWTFGRVLGLIVGLIGMAGFGFCSLCGLVLLVRAMIRRARRGGEE
jgi:hypothetical protein